jgi:hypothetical protein
VHGAASKGKASATFQAAIHATRDTADNKITLAEGARVVALTDCSLNFAAEGAFVGGGAAAGTSNTCPEVVPSDNNDPNIV